LVTDSVGLKSTVRCDDADVHEDDEGNLETNDDDDESHGPEADVVVDDHAELLTILGV
jgi:hypothetical protein